MPKVRCDAVALVKIKHWSMRKTARYFGVQPSTVSRWCKKDCWGGAHEIPTESSRPKTNPKALSRDIVSEISTRRVFGPCCTHYSFV